VTKNVTVEEEKTRPGKGGAAALTGQLTAAQRKKTFLALERKTGTLLALQIAKRKAG